MTFTHRERVKAAIERRETDRVPVDLGGLACSIVDVPPYGYSKFCEYLGLREYGPITYGDGRAVFPVDERILKRFDIDIRHITMKEPVKELPGGVWEDSFGCRWKESPSKHMDYPVDHPLRQAKSIKDIEDYSKWPNPKDPAFTGHEAEAKKLHEETDYAIMAQPECVASIFYRYAWLKGFNEVFIDMKTNPEFYCALTDKILEVNSQLMTVYLNEVGDYVDMVWIGDDMGAQAGPFMSIEEYRKYVKPWFKKSIALIRKLAPKSKIFYHCCGSIHELIPEFIDCGIDILNPLTPSAKSMEHERLKRDYGDKLCFHGGIDVQTILPFGNPKTVKDYVRKAVSVMSPSYILAPSHEIQGDVPPQNIEAMLVAALEIRQER